MKVGILVWKVRIVMDNRMVLEGGIVTRKRGIGVIRIDMGGNGGKELRRREC